MSNPASLSLLSAPTLSLCLPPHPVLGSWLETHECRAALETDVWLNSFGVAIRLFVCLSNCLSICLGVSLFICLSVCMSVCLGLFLSPSVSLSLQVSPPFSLSVSQSVCLFLSPVVHSINDGNGGLFIFAICCHNTRVSIALAPLALTSHIYLSLSLPLSLVLSSYPLQLCNFQSSQFKDAQRASVAS